MIAANERTAAVINGQLIADEIRSRIASEVRRMEDSIGKVPGLAVIVVGERRDSQTYVRNKIIACEEVGIVSTVTELPDDCTLDELLNAVDSFNVDPSVHGILVQLPLPQVIFLKYCLKLNNYDVSLEVFNFPCLLISTSRASIVLLEWGS